MSAEEVRRLLEQVQRGISQPSVALECHCNNLETVYVSLTQADEILVSDQGKTFAYLDRGEDSAYRSVEKLDIAAAAETCRQSGAKLWRNDPETYPRIETVVVPEGSVAEAVERVAKAIDGVFHLALRDDLK